MSGPIGQTLHNLAGAVEYIGGGVGLVVVSESLGPSFRTSGLVVLGSAVAMTVAPSSRVRGLVQRVAECCLFGGLLIAAMRIDG